MTSSRPPFRRTARLLAVILACAGIAAGCSGHPSSSSANSPEPKVSAVEGKMPTPPEGLAAFYNQKLTWERCSDGKAECAQARVPIDYTKPDGAQATIALAKMPAAKTPKGTILVNPGGPGGSGIDMALQAKLYLPSAVWHNYDVIGFDPRGVGESTPAIDCVSDTELGHVLDKSYPDSEAGVAEFNADATKLDQACAAHSGAILPYVGTANAARDLDVLRQLAGQPKLVYLGFSYGTFLSQEYAQLFPHNVGRMVLDGVEDPTAGSAQMGYAQSLGFERALRNYMDTCVKQSSCPFNGSTDAGLGKVRTLFDDALAHPIPTSDKSRPLTQSAFFSGIAAALYSQQTWPILTEAFTQVVNKNDGSMFQYLADTMNSREGNKFTNNSNEAFWAINCADFPASTPEEMAPLAAELTKKGTVFGDFMMRGNDICTDWAYKPHSNPSPQTAQDIAPIVLVGTTNDPATPYAWAQSVHSRLKNSVLLTWEGNGHTAYSTANACLQDPVTAYLLNGTVPKDGLKCKATS